MIIYNIHVENFIGARFVKVALRKPVALFAGKNGSGKSSLQEAIRMAMTGESVRVSHKNQYAALVTEGYKFGLVEVLGTDEGQEWIASIIIPSGKGQHSTDAFVEFVLDAQRFARMDTADRRSFLFGLMGLSTDSATVKDRLTVRGCDAEKVEQIVPFIRSGFEAAAKEAASNARATKAAWKAITGGETWGKDKASNWQPPPRPGSEYMMDSTLLDNAVSNLKQAESDLSVAQQTLGAAKADQRRHNELAETREKLQQDAGKIGRIQKKLAHDTQEFAIWEEKVAAARAKASVVQNPNDQDKSLLRNLAVVTDKLLIVAKDNPDLFESGLVSRASSHLDEYKKHHGWPHSSKDQSAKEAAEREEAATKMPEYERALTLLLNSVINGKRDLEAAQRAAERLKELDEIKPAIDTSAAEEMVVELTQKRKDWQEKVEKFRDIADKNARRKEQVERAARLHADILEWSAIADALSPDGIPGEMLAAALGPINERLAHSANEAQWKRVNVGRDMSIYAAEEGEAPRPYALLSESEKWRADAMIAEAISHVSGVRLLVLDRFDVLDLQGRADLLCWLDALADAEEIDTAIIFGTLKALPEQLPDSAEAFWIENGKCVGKIKEAA